MTPDHIAHLNQAKHNHKWAQLIISSNPSMRDWALTSAFYAALHYTMAISVCLPSEDRFIPKKSSTESIHLQQLSWVKKQLGNNCFKAYRALYQASDDVRYIRDFTGTENIPSLSYYDPAEAKDIINGIQTIITEAKSQKNINLQ